MRKSVFFLTALTLLIYVPAGLSQANDRDEEYRVYSAILKAKYKGDAQKNLVIIRTTSSGQALSTPEAEQNILHALSPLKDETLRSYNSRINTEIELSDKFGVSAKVTLVDEKEIKDLFKRLGLDGWKEFYRKHPDSGGIIRFSRIGFDANGNQALVFVTHSCGSLCASGKYYLLVKDNGEWKVQNENLVWIS